MNEAYVQHTRCLLQFQIIHNLKFNLGQIMFDHIRSLSQKLDSKFSLPNSAMIWRLLNAQHPVPINHSTMDPPVVDPPVVDSDFMEHPVMHPPGIDPSTRKPSPCGLKKSAESSASQTNMRSTVQEIIRLCNLLLSSGPEDLQEETTQD